MQVFNEIFVLPDNFNERKERKGKQRKDDILNNPFIHKRIGVLYKE